MGARESVDGLDVSRQRGGGGGQLLGTSLGRRQGGRDPSSSWTRRRPASQGDKLNHVFGEDLKCGCADQELPE